MKIQQSEMVNLTLAVSFFLTGALRLNAHPQVDLTPAPPMGWNSFDSYGVYLHERAALANVEAMAEKLRPFGYAYFVVDNGWFGEYKLVPGTIYPAEKHAHDVNLNAYGHFLPSQVYFPNGLQPIVDRCHDLGLKFGVHLMRGIPRKAYELNLPIEGTAYTARDVAITDPALNCRWCTYCYGVDMAHPGGQAWYNGLIQHIAELGVDFIKYDDIVPYPAEVEAVAKAISECGRPIALSLSPGGSVDPNAIDSFRMANMLRVTKDIWDEQDDIDACFSAWRRWQGKERPGFWIDMDMIPFGQLQLMSPRGEDQDPMSKGDIALAGKGVNRWCQLSEAQKRTFITLRAMAASPLMMGGDLPTLDAYSLSLITNEHMLACNQNGVMGELLYERDGVEVWRAMHKDQAEAGWVGVFNRSEEVQGLTVTPEMLGLNPGPSVHVEDVWNDRSFLLNEAQSQLVQLEAHDVLFLSFQPAPLAKRPNIVYILADDLGYGDLGCYGQQEIQTPHLDQLAREGIRFTQHYAGSTVCAPSRCVLMTGRHVGHAQVRGNREVKLMGQWPMAPNTRTVAHLMKSAGYQTALIGKWGLGGPGTASHPNRMGFDHFFGYLCQRHAHNYFPEFLYCNHERIPLDNELQTAFARRGDGAGVAAKKNEYAHDRLIKEALTWIRQNKTSPFFLCLTVTIPHANNEAGNQGMETPSLGIYKDKEWPAPQKGTAAMVSRLDGDVKRLTNTLKTLGLEQNTLVLFSSDNGPHREGGNDPEFFRSSGPLRGYKRDLYDGGIRVPLIAYWPGTIQPGQVSDHISGFQDMLPTFADLVGMPTPEGLDGMSMAPTLLGVGEQAQHDYLYWEFHSQGGKQAVRHQHWKGIRLGVSQDRQAPLALYDLRTDVGERRNVADQYPEIVTHIERIMQDAHEPSRHFEF